MPAPTKDLVIIAVDILEQAWIDLAVRLLGTKLWAIQHQIQGRRFTKAAFGARIRRRRSDVRAASLLHIFSQISTQASRKFNASLVINVQLRLSIACWHILATEFATGVQSLIY